MLFKNKIPGAIFFFYLDTRFINKWICFKIFFTEYQIHHGLFKYLTNFKVKQVRKNQPYPLIQ